MVALAGPVDPIDRASELRQPRHPGVDLGIRNAFVIEQRRHNAAIGAVGGDMVEAGDAARDHGLAWPEDIDMNARIACRVG